MGERGPISQPKGSLGKPASERLMELPAVPDELSPALASAWQAYWDNPVSFVAEVVDVPMIRRLFGLYAQHEKAAAVVAQALVVKGSVGQIRVNPLADHLLKLETAILRLENELGLTPMARVRLGIQLRTEDDDQDAPSVIDQLAERRRTS